MLHCAHKCVDDECWVAGRFKNDAIYSADVVHESDHTTVQKCYGRLSPGALLVKI